MVSKKRNAFVKSLRGGWIQTGGGGWGDGKRCRRGEASTALSAPGVRGGSGGEMKTYFKRGGDTAVTESQEVLTCIWAACQSVQPPATVPSRVVQTAELCCVLSPSWDYNTARLRRRDK